MSPRHEVDEVLGDLLRQRRVPVDEQRLEAIRKGLHRQGARWQPRERPGFFPRHRLSLSFATALVVSGFLVWSLGPLRPDRGGTLVSSRLLEIVEDEGRVDQALALLGGFASASSGEGATAEWDLTSRSLLGHAQAEDLLQTFYESI